MRLRRHSLDLPVVLDYNKTRILETECIPMKFAVTYDNGQIFQHFGHTEYMKLYTVENGEVVSSEVKSTNGSGHGALAGFLQANGVNVLICGGIGGGAQMALADAGIKLYGGCMGEADRAIADSAWTEAAARLRDALEVKPDHPSNSLLLNNLAKAYT